MDCMAENVQHYQMAQEQGLNTPEAVMEQIEKTLMSPLFGKSQALVVALSQFLPATMKKDFFPLPIAEKVSILNQYLPVELVSQGFVPSRLGWTDKEISKNEVIDRLQKTFLIEQKYLRTFWFIIDNR